MQQRTNYPVIEGNTSNFINDYLAMAPNLDKLIVLQYGQRIFDFYEDMFQDDNDFTAWMATTDAIVSKHLKDWAHLYYGLSLDYNPLYNVDGTEVTSYGATTNTNQYGATENTNQYGQTINTYKSGSKSTSTTTGERINSETAFGMAYPDNARHEKAHTEQNLGSGTDSSTTQPYTDTNTIGQHTDTSSSIAHTDTSSGAAHEDTVRRFGNIGITKSSDLILAEYELRKKNFFDEIFKTILLESGVHYE